MAISTRDYVQHGPQRTVYEIHAPTYQEIVELKYPNYYILGFNGTSFNGITWHPDNPLPALTQAQLDADIAENLAAQQKIVRDSAITEKIADNLASFGVNEGVVHYDQSGNLSLLPMDVLSKSVLRVFTSDVAPRAGTSYIDHPTSNIPVITEGSQVWSLAITPTSLTNRINISGTMLASHSNQERSVAAFIFRGVTCIGATMALVEDKHWCTALSFNITDSPASIGEVIYSIRVIGVEKGGTWYINQNDASWFGGMLAKNGITVMELS